MSTIKPIEKYVITFAKDHDRNDLKYHFMVSINKRVKEVEKELSQCLYSLHGIDMINMVGMYTFEILIAKTFNPDQVLEELKKKLEQDVLCEIIHPKIVV